MRTEEELRQAMADAGARVPGGGPDARRSVARRVRRQRAVRLAPLGLVAAAAIAFAAVQLAGSNGTKKSLVVTNPPSTEVRPEPTTELAAPPTTTADVQASHGTCTTAHLTITAGPFGAAAGHSATFIVFRNTGPTCEMFGYPGVAALNPNGAVVAHARFTPSGYIGGLQGGATSPPTVTLARGDVASAVFEGLNGTPPDMSPCHSYEGLLITPPGQTTSAHLSLPFAMCDLQIHPVVPGSSGGQGQACPDYIFRAQSSDFADNIWAYVTTCTVARSVVAASPDVTSPNFGKNYTARDFTCTAGTEFQPPGGGAAAWPYDCTDQHGARVAFNRHA